MEAALAPEMPATEARERLVAFMDEIVSALPLPIQRANALLYVRGLIEQGGRKSLQPVLRCWDGRCRTCYQPVDLNQLMLFDRRE